jgi:hypothetical protein
MSRKQDVTEYLMATATGWFELPLIKGMIILYLSSFPLPYSNIPT